MMRTKKDTPVKNNSYRFGLLGELFVTKNVQCPRCDMKLWKLKANTPGVDVKCRNDHYFQIKSKNIKSCNDKVEELKILGGSFSHQKESIMGEENADFIMVFYNAVRKRVVKMYWLENKHISRGDIIKRPVNCKVFSRKGGEKKHVGQKVQDLCYIKCNKKRLIEIPMEKTDQLESSNRNKKARTEPVIPDVFYESPTIVRVKKKHNLNLRDMYCRVNIVDGTCDCHEFRRKASCDHIGDVKRYVENDNLQYYQSDRMDKSGSKMIYTINLTERTCTCPHYAWNAPILCKHLKGALQGK